MNLYSLLEFLNIQEIKVCKLLISNLDHLNFGISLVHPTVETYLNVKLIYLYFIFITYFA